MNIFEENTNALIEAFYPIKVKTIGTCDYMLSCKNQDFVKDGMLYAVDIEKCKNQCRYFSEGVK